MSIHIAPDSRQGGTFTSLEDDLAEATQELLDLGKSQKLTISKPNELNPDLHLNTPSPFILSRPNSTNRLDVGKALSIDSNARLTPIFDEFDKKRIEISTNINDNNQDVSTHVEPSESTSTSNYKRNFPASQLHRTIKSVSSDLLSPTIRNSGTSSLGLQLAQNSLREQSWLNEHGERVSSKGKVERRMDLLQNRIYPSSAGSTSTINSKDLISPSTTITTENAHRGTRQEHTPAFFLESFPDAIKTDPIQDKKDKELLEEEHSISQDSMYAQSITPSPSIDSSRVIATHLSSAQPSAATTTETSVTVKLHGNRRAEREAIMSNIGQFEENDLTIDEVLPIDSNFSSSPIQEIDPHPTGEDSSSLISLPATTATSSSQTSSAQRKRMMRRRRSTGSQSYLTGSSIGEGLDHPIYPFARDVNIRGFSIVGEKSRGYVAYDVRIITRNGSTISILRRFSAFVNLRKQLIEECFNSKSKLNGIKQKRSENDVDTSSLTTSIGGNGNRIQNNKPLPQLPPKRTGILQKYASDHLEKRRRGLQKWLTIVMLDSVWGTSKSIRQWVVGNDDDV